MRTPVLLATIVITLSASSSAGAQPEAAWELPEEPWEQPEKLVPDQGVFEARVHADGSVTFVDRSGRPFFIGFSFDITDEIMKARGTDPYANRKLDFLDGTREARVALGREYRRQQYARSAEAMQVNIDEVWRAVPDPVQRKQILFELWDECAETGEPELVAGANAARATLVAFVESHMTGPNGYTREELARFNARRTSTAEFDPYGDSQQRVAGQ